MKGRCRKVAAFFMGRPHARIMCGALRYAQGPAARLHPRGVHTGESGAFAVSVLTLL